MSAMAPITAESPQLFIRSADAARVVVLRHRCESEILTGSECMADWTISKLSRRGGARGGGGTGGPRGGGACPNSAAAREKASGVFKHAGRHIK